MLKKMIIAIFLVVIWVCPCCFGKDAVNWCDISKVWDNSVPIDDLTFVDLFCGAGGLSKGLELAGFRGICGLDYFEEAGRTYKRNFEVPYIHGDVTLPETKERLYSTVRNLLQGKKLTLIVGGFPYQGFSMAGNRVVADPRNVLYKEMITIVAELKPDYVVCENVKGIRSVLGGAVEKKIIEDFREIGYEMNVTTLCAADYKVPQMRERVIFIGNRIGKRNFHPAPLIKPSEYVTVRQAIGDLVAMDEDASINHIFTNHRSDMITKMAALKEGESAYKGYSESWRRCHWDKPSPTVKENHGGTIVHPKLPRVLTPRELARLQSFPGDFIFEGSKTKQLVQLGNAVPVLLAKAIGLAVRHSKEANDEK